MSNRVRHFPLVVACVVLLASMAAAQSAELLDAVRVHAPSAVEQAATELAACVQRRPCRAADRLSLLTGYLELARGRASVAASFLSARPAPRGLEPFHRWYLAEALAYSGAPSQARSTLARAAAGAPPWLARKIALRGAELDLALGRPRRALAVLETAADATPTPELLLSRALARRATGDSVKARADLRLIALRFPAHPHARMAIDALDGVVTPPWSDAEQLLRAQGLLAAGDAAGARAALPAAEDAVTRQEATLLAAKALLAQGKDAEARPLLEAAGRGPSPRVAVDALTTLGKRLLRQGDNRGARHVFVEAEEAYASERGSDEAAYLGAWLTFTAGEDEAAVAAFESFEVRHPASRRRDEARWFRGFGLVRLRRYDAARAALRTLVADFPRSSLVPQAHYWSTRAAQLASLAAPRPPAGATDAGVPVDLAAEYTELTRAAVATVYARLATERLRELGVTPPEPFRQMPEEPSVAGTPPPRLRLAAELTRVGLFPDAHEEVASAVDAVRTAEEAQAFGRALQAMGEYAAAHALAARHLWGPVYGRRSPGAVALMYPRAWSDTVERWASAHGVEPSFVWAIMRRESAFRADVTSAADARGLMQLMPPTARQLASELHLGSFEADELYGPQTNVMLGTRYLAHLFQRFGHPGLVAAAYNAGPRAVAAWLERGRHLPLDQWLEEIPFKETRGYVKQVLADHAIYQALSGTQAPRLSLLLPPTAAEGVDY